MGGGRFLSSQSLLGHKTTKEKLTSSLSVHQHTFTTGSMYCILTQEFLSHILYLYPLNVIKWTIKNHYTNQDTSTVCTFVTISGTRAKFCTEVSSSVPQLLRCHQQQLCVSHQSHLPRPKAKPSLIHSWANEGQGVSQSEPIVLLQLQNYEVT